MIMWDKKYTLTLKEFVNDELETYNGYENQSNAADNISKCIKYRSTLGNVKCVSILMGCIATPTILASNLLISFLLYSLTDITNNGLLMLINGYVQIIATLLLFYTSTRFILLKLKNIVMGDRLWIPPNKAVENRKIHLVFTSCDHKPNQNNTKSLAMPGQWTTDPIVSTEKKLREIITILRRRKDMNMKDIKNINGIAHAITNINETNIM